ncbi:MFS transporter [Streptomyces sp. XM4193]|uniref:MFS transporter n=1 Tax=Streptomyces sp. XM4193 TaxID=2929782 RepID=UPI0035ABF0D6
MNGVGATRLTEREPGRAAPVAALARLIGRAIHRPSAAVGRRIRRATHAEGAGESGLGKLIELHAVNSAGDMMITVALASTIFFSVPTGEARGRVALYLAVTMAPFVLLAPIIGPLLDRLPHGRRAAMAAAMAARALLALMLAGAVAGGGLELYPAALGVLVASKAYGVVRSAVVPRLLPPRVSLVKANSRVTLAGLLATGAAAPVGAGLHQIGPQWPLYGAFVIFAAGMLLSLSLPHMVDSAKGERRAKLAAAAGESEPWLAKHSPGHRRRAARPGLRTVGSSVLNALIANSSIRALSGFLTFFLAFLLREEPFSGMNAAYSLALVAGAAGAGNALGTAVGAWLKGRAPEVNIVLVLILVTTVAVLAALLYGSIVVAVLAGTAGLCQALAKLSQDALIQRDVPEDFRTSAFARSETLMQMSWVLGGAVGISLPLLGPLGLGVGAALVATGALLSVRALLAAARRGTPHPRVA